MRYRVRGNYDPQIVGKAIAVARGQEVQLNAVYGGDRHESGPIIRDITTEDFELRVEWFPNDESQALIRVLGEVLDPNVTITKALAVLADDQVFLLDVSDMSVIIGPIDLAVPGGVPTQFALEVTPDLTKIFVSYPGTAGNVVAYDRQGTLLWNQPLNIDGELAYLNNKVYTHLRTTGESFNRLIAMNEVTGAYSAGSQIGPINSFTKGVQAVDGFVYSVVIEEVDPTTNNSYIYKGTGTNRQLLTYEPGSTDNILIYLGKDLTESDNALYIVEFESDEGGVPVVSWQALSPASLLDVPAKDYTTTAFPPAAFDGDEFEASGSVVTKYSSPSVASPTLASGITWLLPLSLQRNLTLLSLNGVADILRDDSAYSQQLVANIGDPATPIDSSHPSWPTWALKRGPAGATVDSEGLVEWSSPTAGTENFRVTAENTLEGWDTVTWEVIIHDTAPIIDAIGNQVHFLATPPYISPTPSLTAGDTPVTWSLIVGPTGMTMPDSSTGKVSWVPSSTGTYPVTIRATNGKGFDEESWDILVL